VNAAFEHNALTANLRVLTGKSNYFRLSIWWQESDRQLPPLVTTPAAFASQYDNVLRASANWTGQVGIGEMQVRTGLFREKIHFHDSLHHLNAQNTAHTLVQEAEWSVPIRNRHRFQAGVNHTYNWAMADGYHHPLRTQRRAALFASAGSAWYNKRLQTLLAMRQEWYDVHTAPAIPSFSASWRFNSSYLVRTQFAATFRIPTLNDLYWIPGGNPDLKPERGKSAEFSLEYARSAKAFHVSWNSGFFINQVNSRILWEPGSFYWKPSNIGQVTSMGVESRIELHVQTGRNHFKMLLNAQYVRSGVTGEKRGQFIPEQQLIYTPFLLSSGLLEFRRGYFTAFIQGTYNGLRYTSSDNSQSLPGFFLADAGFNLDLPVNTVPMGLFFSCRNMFNTAYEVTLWRPMALRSWHAGIQFFIQKSNPNQS
jgi:iron complex outermembrane receptor protein